MSDKSDENRINSAMGAGEWRLATFDRGAVHREAARRVRDWVRDRFALAEDDVVTANEVACEVPGCPPLETAISFWTQGPDGQARRHHYKVFKPIAEVVEQDLPPRWMKPALEVGEDFYCSCC